MTKPKPKNPPGVAVDLGIPDIASLLYKDRSGAKLGGGVSEGRSNFGAVTAEALKTVAALEPLDPVPA